jgi:YibE/F-like protein
VHEAAVPDRRENNALTTRWCPSSTEPIGLRPGFAYGGTRTGARWFSYALGTYGLPESKAPTWSCWWRVGRDHIASTIYTLVLAYARAALPLLLLFDLGGRGFTSVITSETIAKEVVRTLVRSLGLVASVPLTTGLAAVVVTAASRAAHPAPVASTTSSISPPTATSLEL